MTNNNAILRAAYSAWSAANALRSRRLRNKRFTYGDQWSDATTDAEGNPTTEEALIYHKYGTAPITNNVLRQMVKTIVGRFRAEHLRRISEPKELKAIAQENAVDELDSRALEEFLISGCCIQRIDETDRLGEKHVEVSNVNLAHFFMNHTTDPLNRDCEIVGQLHDLSIAELIKRVAPGNKKKAAWVRRLYSDAPDERTLQFCTAIGTDPQSGSPFWFSRSNKCRVIEVWTLESQEVLLCHDKTTAKVTVMPISMEKKIKADPHISYKWDIATMWRCRWFTPMGDVLTTFDSPYSHRSHPFVVKFYPLTDGEVHGFIEDVIDQQKYINRLITIVDRILSNSAKGVLLYPESAKPGSLSWNTILRIWNETGGVLPYSPDGSLAKPEQVSHDNTNIGIFEMINLQMKLMENVSGVTGSLQGQNVNTSGSASLYQSQAANSSIALYDIFDTFNNFRSLRNQKLLNL